MEHKQFQPQKNDQNRNFFESVRQNIPGMSINEKEIVRDLINCLSNVKGK